MTVDEWKKKNTPIRRKPKTNYDLLISKTPEEMADFLPEIRNALTCILGTEEGCPRPDTPCSECWLDWLMAPVGKEDKG